LSGPTSKRAVCNIHLWCQFSCIYRQPTLPQTPTMSSTTKTTKTVSLVQKSTSFFDDAFFKDAWEDFDTAMQTVLDKFDDKGRKITSGSRNECRDVYRNIRSSKIDEDLYTSQALQVTEKDGRFSCVMDVKDFTPTDLQVKVVDDRVVVEGKYEKKSEDGKSSSSKSFHKEFNLPACANLDLVSTALSKDGVLTVRAPKKEGTEIVPASDGTVKKSSSSVEESSSVQQSSTGSSDSSSMVKKSSTVQQSSTSSSAVSSSAVEQSSVQQSSSVKKQSFSQSSVSSFSSSFSSKNESSNISGAIGEGFGKISMDDMEKAMNDRLVFTHESVNMKLPEN